MKTIIAAALAASAIASVAAPALAQPYGPPPPPHGDWHGPGPGGPGWGGPVRPEAFPLDQRISWMQDRINRGRADGSLDRHEAFRAQRSLNSINNDLRRDRWHGGGRLNDYDRQNLEARLDRLNDQLHWMRQNDDRRPW